MIIFTATLSPDHRGRRRICGRCGQQRSIHWLGGDFVLSGHHLGRLSARRLFLYSIDVRIGGLLGFSMLPGASSPRWPVKRDDHDGARKVLERIRAPGADVSGDLQDIVEVEDLERKAGVNRCWHGAFPAARLQAPGSRTGGGKHRGPGLRRPTLYWSCQSLPRVLVHGDGPLWLSLQLGQDRA